MIDIVPGSFSFALTQKIFVLYLQQSELAQPFQSLRRRVLQLFLSPGVSDS